jgi:hypothetical protein
MASGEWVTSLPHRDARGAAHPSAQFEVKTPLAHCVNSQVCRIDGAPDLDTGAAFVDDRPTVEDLEHLYASLTRDEREELLQELLVAGGHGGEAMVAVIDAWLLDRAGRGLLRGLVPPCCSPGNGSAPVGLVHCWVLASYNHASPPDGIATPGATNPEGGLFGSKPELETGTSPPPIMMEL